MSDISVYSAGQLADLVPGALKDEDLLVAYQTANALDSPQTALRFAEEMVRRPSLTGQVNLISVFRRLVSDRFERDRLEEAMELIDAAARFDTEQNAGAARSILDSLRAKILLAQGQVEQACSLWHEIFERDQENVEVIAEAVERLMSASKYASALDLAELGLQRAETLRLGDQQRQFRELAAEARERA